MDIQLTTVQARDPRNSFPTLHKYGLSDRLNSLDTARVCFIQCMPPYDLSKEMDATKTALLSHYPNCKIEYFNRRDFMIDDPKERETIPERADAVILFIGPTATSLHVHWKYGIGLEAAGVPVSLVVPPSLEGGAKHEEVVRGTRLRWVLAPVYKASAESITTKANAAFNALIQPLSTEEESSGTYTPPQVEDYACEGTTDEIQAFFLREALTDGLPIIIPTDDKITAMLGGTSRHPKDIVCENLRPEGLSTTVEKVAINAVMAGAKPEYFPVILAAVSLYGNIQLESMTRSLNAFAFTHIINGPLGRQLQIESGVNALGSGNHVNSTIGRALELVFKNCGYQHYGTNSNPVMGNPIGITVVAENEEESPWPPLHTGLGFNSKANVISLFVGGHAFIGNYNYGGLTEVSKDMKGFANKTGALLLLSAKRAQEWADKGLTKELIIEQLWSETTATLGEFRSEVLFMLFKALIERGGDNSPWPKDYLTRPDEDIVPVFAKAGIHVGVIGSTLASIMHLWSSVHLQSASIDDWI